MVQEYDNWWQKGNTGDQEMEDSHQEGWKKVIELIDIDDVKNRDVLDFGCNQGGFLRTLYDTTPFYSACGIDLAKKAIGVAKERVDGYPIEYFQTGDAASLERKFHTVISTSVLYLIENIDEHFRMISSVLNDGGVYYASFADQSKNPSFDYMKEKIDQFGATKMQNKTLSEVVDSLIQNGFSVELLKEYTEPVYSVTNYKEFYLSVDDYILSCENSYLIKARKTGSNA
ncbi:MULTISPECIES: class I SAM-dependent methyltransferase [Brevibacillus]|uniref:class I SAM-dependent methyltransferase n=1 Tax=Brevibacillus TaxID=55080 RepID=UPI000B9B3568|nr:MULTISPECIES: class I SAM-dependent methyltransferase [Brevibacillus]MBG9789843.1 methyltransferase [Brevibacillus laterosporus]MBG9804042.1 methyltransferase [Brevibacillus laterosporus]MED1788426.1 class I SAM-dependent methyltransferase [Brevibacillus laterosporus]MED4765544.1 class I SAM-dependent methyltransferase [Brevibacillus laterosporus]RFB31883.1 class I SAM-dependent methyltransferase [Brevibacillus sp. VP]